MRSLSSLSLTFVAALLVFLRLSLCLHFLAYITLYPLLYITQTKHRIFFSKPSNRPPGFSPPSQVHSGPPNFKSLPEREIDSISVRNPTQTDSLSGTIVLGLFGQFCLFSASLSADHHFDPCSCISLSSLLKPSCLARYKLPGQTHSHLLSASKWLLPLLPTLVLPFSQVSAREESAQSLALPPTPPLLQAPSMFLDTRPLP